MKRIIIMTVLTVVCIGSFTGCSSDSDMPTSKELLAEILTQGQWQASFKQASTQTTFDVADIQLAFSNLSEVHATTSSMPSNQLNSYGGAYVLYYNAEEQPDVNEELEYYYDESKAEDLFLSLAFGMHEVLILNQQWRVKKISSTVVTLQANDVVLTLAQL